MSDITRNTAESVRIRISGKYGSIQDLVWDNVPPFALLTGMNGVGKTQLLEVLASSFGQLRRRSTSPLMQGAPQVDARAEIEPSQFKPSEVFHSYSDWDRIPDAEANETQIEEKIRSLKGGGNPPAWWEAKIAEESGLTVENIRSLSTDDFYPLITPGMLWARNAPASVESLSYLFLAYALLERDAKERGETSDQIRKRFGEAPWDLLNEILSVSRLPYMVNSPSPEHLKSTTIRKPSFAARLLDLERKTYIPFSGLSSGEKVIISTVLWQYSAEQVGQHYRLLLLDEPDAHLHPSLTRQFFDVIQEVFVRRRGVRVIATTHSPSTVAFAPESSIFEMRRHSDDRTSRITPISRDRAISLLTAGLLVVTEKTSLVFVEGKDDPSFYQMVWQLCTEAPNEASNPLLNHSPSLVFQPVGAQERRGPENTGKEQVIRLVRELRKYRLANPVAGIIDRDDGNPEVNGIYAASERRSIEHYLYDPLVVWIALRQTGKGNAPPIPALPLNEGQEYRLGGLASIELQSVADRVLASVEPKIEPTREEKQRRPIHLKRGDEAIALQYPIWQLERSKTDIRAAYHTTYPELRPEGLFQAYRTLRLIPEDVLNILEKIQTEGA